MNIDYSFLLFVLVLVSGLVWLFDALFAARKRKTAYRDYLRKQGITEDEVNQYAVAAAADKASSVSGAKVAKLRQANELRKESALVEYSKAFFPILFAVLFFRAFLFEPFQIPTGSMIPSLQIGDYIVVNKFSYGVRLPIIGTKIIDGGDPQRGDVMVFVPPHDPNYFVKRVVGLPGDHVRYQDKMIYINGKAMPQEIVETEYEDASRAVYALELLGDVEHMVRLESAYDYYRQDFWLAPEGRVVPEGHYFMMGDNRDNSDDSRRWGVVPEENIVGEAVAVWMHKDPGLNLPTFSQNRFITP